MSETQRILRNHSRLEVPEATIRSWLDEHRPLTPYARLRAAAKKLYPPSDIVRATTFYHQQVYRFQVHRAKLDLLLAPPEHSHLSTLKDYLASVEKNFPHDIF